MLYSSYNLIQANGFYGSKGVFGRVPECYTFCEQLFMKNVRAHQRQAERQGVASASRTRIELQEWTRDNWTYHAKGIAGTGSMRLTILLICCMFNQAYGFRRRRPTRQSLRSSFKQFEFTFSLSGYRTIADADHIFGILTPNFARGAARLAEALTAMEGRPKKCQLSRQAYSFIPQVVHSFRFLQVLGERIIAMDSSCHQ